MLMVGRVGLEPTYPEGSGFTARCNCRYATDPYRSGRVASSLNLLDRFIALRSANHTFSAYFVLLLVGNPGFKPRSVHSDAGFTVIKEKKLLKEY